MPPGNNSSGVDVADGGVNLVGKTCPVPRLMVKLYGSGDATVSMMRSPTLIPVLGRGLGACTRRGWGTPSRINLSPGFIAQLLVQLVGLTLKPLLSVLQQLVHL